MSRYFVRPKMAAWTAPSETEIEAGPPLAVTVWPSDARDTGLLDTDGNPIMATDSIPLGFLAGERE